MQKLKSQKHERSRTKKSSYAASIKHRAPKQTPEQAAAFEKMVASAVDTGDPTLSQKEPLSPKLLFKRHPVSGLWYNAAPNQANPTLEEIAEALEDFP